jgi:SAM-dependent methyltransferase
VWVTGQIDPRTQLADGGYVPATALDRHRIAPAVVAHAIDHYTRPGGLVLDPDCGAGTVLVEALRAGRHAVGVTTDRRLWETARANLTAAKRGGAATDGMVLDHSARSAASADGRGEPLAGLCGRVDLVLTATRHLERPDPRRSGLGPDLAAFFARVRGLLHADGHLVLALSRPRRHGHLIDIADAATAAAHACGLVAVDRCVALLAEIRGHRLVTHATLSQRRATDRHQRSTGHAIGLRAHQDLLVFRPAVAASIGSGARAAESEPAAEALAVVSSRGRDVLCAA